MATSSYRQIAAAAWERSQGQHDTITYAQLRDVGFTHGAIRHRQRVGRLFELWPAVYTVGRPNPTRLGLWKAATMACGPDCALAGESGAALRGVRNHELPCIEIAIPEGEKRALKGIRTYRVRGLSDHVTEARGIPVCTTPLLLVQLAGRLGRDSIEMAINEADKRDLIDPEALRASLDSLRGRPGVAKLRRVLDRHTFRLSQSQLERRFRPIARRAGLPEPLMGGEVNGFDVDFYWPSLNYVVETDGLRYHRTAITQTRDLVRDQTHDTAGTAHSRFSHAQIRFEPGYVEHVLRARRLELESVVS